MFVPDLICGAVDMTVIFTRLSGGFLKTLIIFFLTLILSLPLGLLVTFGRMSKIKILQYAVKFYISVMRGTPLMLQLLIVFFAPSYIFNAKIPLEYRFWAVIIGFALNYAAYFAEIYRSGIENVPKGQYEAAMLLGFSKSQTFIKIILPQVIKNVLPAITNEVITLVKDTSLAYVLAYTEMFKVAKEVSAAQSSIAPLMVAGLFYYVMNLLVAFVMGKAEKSMDYYTR
ncbi:MAG: amino acid ABC transporter permease [Clostridiales bacterium]|nr:amino acid ABC transporter permease [Clostridiales bacterium]